MYSDAIVRHLAGWIPKPCVHKYLDNLGILKVDLSGKVYVDIIFRNEDIEICHYKHI